MLPPGRVYPHLPVADVDHVDDAAVEALDVDLPEGSVRCPLGGR